MGLRKRSKLVAGVGINDADYAVYKGHMVDGKFVVNWVCPYYPKWTALLQRCYDVEVQKRKPTYVGCTVCEEWLRFSNFKAWMEKQDWEGNELDKDVLVSGNKIYSPDTCVFVNKVINLFISDCKRRRGEHPLGVNLIITTGKFVSRCSNPFIRKQEHLGTYKTPEEAHLAWKTRKHELACQLADSEYVTDERVANALRTRYK